VASTWVFARYPDHDPDIDLDLDPDPDLDHDHDLDLDPPGGALHAVIG